MAEHETIADIIAEMRKSDCDKICPWWADGGSCDLCPLGRNGKNCSFSNYADRLDAALKRERGDCAKLREALEYPKDANDKYIHIGDAVHMLNTNHEGDHEWDDVVLSFEYVGKGGGDDWLVYGKDGAAWACECEVLNQKGGNDAD